MKNASLESKSNISIRVKRAKTIFCWLDLRNYIGFIGVSFMINYLSNRFRKSQVYKTRWASKKTFYRSSFQLSSQSVYLDLSTPIPLLQELKSENTEPENSL